MNATLYEITQRRRQSPLGLADIKDFELRQSGQIAATAILEQPNITLYTIDFVEGQAVFVETPPEIDLSQAPFYYAAQYEHAVRVLSIALETMIQLAQAITVDDERLIFIYSVGRAGSTLASQLFSQVADVVSLSEPDALTLLVAARYAQPDHQDDLKTLLHATVRILCKGPATTTWVIKGRSFMIELGDWLHACFPQTKNLFLYRDAKTWLNSWLVAVSSFVDRTDEARWLAFEEEMRSAMTPFNPLLAQYEEDRHLPLAGILSLMWLSVMDRYLNLHQRGIRMLAIRYDQWLSAPQETAVEILHYCGCQPTSMTVIDDVLAKDSQAGTVLSQAAVRQQKGGAQDDDIQELNQHLQKHAIIRIIDFEVPNTL